MGVDGHTCQYVSMQVPTLMEWISMQDAAYVCQHSPEQTVAPRSPPQALCWMRAGALTVPALSAATALTT